MAKKKKEEEQIPAQETAETPETPEEAPAEPGWEEKYNQERDAHLRLAADYDNYRKRTLKEKEQTGRSLSASLRALVLLTVLRFMVMPMSIFPATVTTGLRETMSA